MVSETTSPTGRYSTLPSEQETLTQGTWGELFSKSKECVPGFLVGFILCSSGKTVAYDGIALKKYLQVNKNAKDPTTNLPIDKVHYLYVKTFNLDEEETQNIRQPVFTEEKLISTLPTLRQYYETGLNYHGFLSAKDENVKKLIAQSQYIFGSNLFSSKEEELQKEGVRWLTCSANNQCVEAAAFLTHIYQRGLGVPRDPKKAQYFSKKIASPI